MGFGGCGVIMWSCWEWCSGVGLSGAIGLVSLLDLSGAVGLVSLFGLSGAVGLVSPFWSLWSWASLEPNGVWSWSVSGANWSLELRKWSL